MPTEAHTSPKAPPEPPPTGLSNPPQATRRHDKSCHMVVSANYPETMVGAQGAPRGIQTPSAHLQGPQATPARKRYQNRPLQPFNPATTSKYSFASFLYIISVYKVLKSSNRTQESKYCVHVLTFFGKDSNNTNNDNNNDNNNNNTINTDHNNQDNNNNNNVN